MATKKVNKKVTVKKTSKVVGKKVEVKKIKVDRSRVLKMIGIALLFVLSFATIDLFVQYLNNGYSVAVVNGVRVPRKEFYERLEKAYGAQASQTLIEEQLIIQESLKQGYNVSSADVDERITQIEEEIGGAEVLEQALSANSITMDDLKRQVRLELLTKEVLEPTIVYEQSDVEEFFDKYKDVLYPDQDVKFEDKQEETTQSYIDNEVQAAKTAWLAELVEGARIQNNITEKPKYGFLKVTINIVNNLVNQFKPAN